MPTREHARGRDRQRAHKRFDESGALTDETSRKLVGQLLAALVALTRRTRGEGL